ncbi:hypothetical protein ERO13_D03G023166v2 [Gossypium hirsutum]|uniref:Mur ligase C-terminal domain-containing protein n=3 Tax=Gossypium TaxID=3633 RepID=A0A5J5S6U8_GOSBA|nr:hypothetical protein ES319_D03G023800v1 [Gossypium barbadense]KAG4153904.1 hypothetical protein ERO13_D03G023166v2 [Gossypium hirsutum]TYG75389.1 hypothetical protein ES288_D03G027200v1 [Gossypium darwinii]TYI89012.1 hypothetical protein E1A91_D03G024200v1 [Gossypium mustelinum]
MQVNRSVDTEHGQLSPQETKTVEAIVKASEYPLSIILVGVGVELGIQVVLQKNMEMVEFVIPTLGLHMAVNDCAAAAVATSMGVPVSLRSEFVVAESGIKIVNDAFNANPISTKAGIDTLKNINCDGKRVAILGDMFELGTHEIRVP